MALTPAASLVELPPAGSPTPGSPAPAARAEEPSEAVVDAAAREELARVVAALVAAFDAEEQQSDAPRLAAALCDGGEAAIRQPPTAAKQALAVTRHPECTPAALVQLAEANPVLAQGLFKAANSVHYAAGGAPCRSLRDAVRRLGTSGVANVVLATMVEGLVCRPGAAYQSMVDDVWSHLVRTAPIARALAPVFGAVPDEAFALGLLHDVGKLVVFDAIAVLRGDLRREVAVPPATLARLLRAAHGPLGAMAAARWGMGATMARAIGAHHASAALPSPQAEPLRQLVQIAERAELAHHRGEELRLAEWWSAAGCTDALPQAETALQAALASAEK